MEPRLIRRMMWTYTFELIAVLLVQNTVGQSNYASHANNVNYLGEGLPGEATLDGKVRFKNMEFQQTKKKRLTPQFIEFIAAISICVVSIIAAYKVCLFSIIMFPAELQCVVSACNICASR